MLLLHGISCDWFSVDRQRCILLLLRLLWSDQHILSVPQSLRQYGELCGALADVRGEGEIERESVCVRDHALGMQEAKGGAVGGIRWRRIS